MRHDHQEDHFFNQKITTHEDWNIVFDRHGKVLVRQSDYPDALRNAICGAALMLDFPARSTDTFRRTNTEPKGFLKLDRECVRDPASEDSMQLTDNVLLQKSTPDSLIVAAVLLVQYEPSLAAVLSSARLVTSWEKATALTTSSRPSSQCEISC